MYQFSSERLRFRTIQRSENPTFVDVYAGNRYYLSFFEPDASTDLERHGHLSRTPGSVRRTLGCTSFAMTCTVRGLAWSCSTGQRKSS